MEESHQAIRPVEVHVRNPGLDVKSHRESKTEAECVQDYGRLCRILREDLAGVAVGEIVSSGSKPCSGINLLHSDGGDGQRAECDEDLGKGENSPTPVILQRRAEEAESERVTNQCRKPEGVETVLRLPGTPVPCTDGERESITNKLAIDEGNSNADPVSEGD